MKATSKARNAELHVIKASGNISSFSEEKFISSLVRAGASLEHAQSILEQLRPKIFEGITTKRIYRIAHSLLKKYTGGLAGKYSLKRGIMELGPSGFPFEKYVSEVLRLQGYSTTTGQIVKGQCVNHEIDVIAEKDNHHYMVECKYHNQPGNVSDVKVPLYIQARFKDVEAAWKLLPGHEEKFHQGWVVTNTRFTSDAIQYGQCCGLRLIGWDYPAGGSLSFMVDQLGLYPLTCLTTLTKKEKEDLLGRKVVLVRELCDDQRLLSYVGVREPRLGLVLKECELLCVRQVLS